MKIVHVKMFSSSRVDDENFLILKSKFVVLLIKL